MGQEYVWAVAKRQWRNRLLEAAMDEDSSFDMLSEVEIIMERLLLKESAMRGCAREGIRQILTAEPIKSDNWLEDLREPKVTAADEVLDLAVEGQMPSDGDESLGLPNQEQVAELCSESEE